MTKPTFIVTFHNSYDKLTSMFIEKFNSVKAAKEAIEFDAEYFLKTHNFRSKHDTYIGKRRTATAKWVKPDTLDYYEVKAKDGSSCIYQYFKI